MFYFEVYVQESMIFFANTTFVWAPHFPPSSHTVLRNIVCPLDPPLLQYIPYNIGDEISCKGQGATTLAHLVRFEERMLGAARGRLVEKVDAAAPGNIYIYIYI